MSAQNSKSATQRVPGVLRELSAAQAENLDARGVPKHLGRLQRAVTLEGYDADKRTVTMAVSSETPVERYFGSEVLSHDAGAIDLSRIKQGVTPLLFNHNYDAHLGRVATAKVEDGVLRVTASFASNPLAKEKEGDVASGDLVAVSIGYIVDEWDVVEDKNGNRDYTGTKWQLLEVSLVTVPADPSVGVGRASDPAPNIRSFRKLDADGEETDTDTGDEEDDDESDEDAEDERAAAAANQDPAPPTPNPEAQRTTAMAEATAGPDLAAQNAERVAGLRALNKQYPTEFNERSLKAAEDLGVGVEAVKVRVADALIAAAQRSDVPTLGEELLSEMSEGERNAFSLTEVYQQALRAKSGTPASGIVREVSDAMRKKATERGLTGFGDGLLLPSASSRTPGVRAQQRAISSGGNAGSSTNFTIVEADPIELLRFRCAVLASGATMMPGLQGAFSFPKQTGAATSNWLPELGTATNSDPTLAAFQMTPKRLTIANSYTRDFLAQSRLAIDSFLSNDRMAVLARALDSAGLAGSGVAPIPLGILNQTGLAAVLAGSTRAQSGTVTSGAGGVPMTYVDYIAMESAIANANADIAPLSWIMTPRIRGAARSTPKTPGTATDYIFPDSVAGADGRQLGPLGYQAIITSNPALKGFAANSVSNLEACILAAWSQLLIGDWGLSEVIVDNITGAAQALVKITEQAYYDINVRHIESFVACTSALPS